MAQYKCIRSFDTISTHYWYGNEISAYEYSRLSRYEMKHFVLIEDDRPSVSSYSLGISDSQISDYTTYSTPDPDIPDSSSNDSSSSNDFGGGDFGGGGSSENY